MPVLHADRVVQDLAAGRLELADHIMGGTPELFGSHIGLVLEEHGVAWTFTNMTTVGCPCFNAKVVPKNAAMATFQGSSLVASTKA